MEPWRGIAAGKPAVKAAYERPCCHPVPPAIGRKYRCGGAGNNLPHGQCDGWQGRYMRAFLISSILIVAAVVLAVTGWKTWIGLMAPNDLVFDSAEVRRIADAGMTDAQGKMHEHYDDMLIVNFRSRVDLQTLARRFGLHLYMATSPCSGSQVDQKRLLFAGWNPSPLDAYGRVDVWSYDRSGNARTRPSGRRDPSGSITYHAISDLSLSGAILPELCHYDLAHRPTRLCSELEASNDVAGEAYFHAFTSNTIVIPKEAVATAVARARHQ